MSNKAINKDYLLNQLRNFDEDVLSLIYSPISQEMTQAEYDALSEEEKNDDTIRFITDGTSGGGSVTIFIGTTARWEALTTIEKSYYILVYLTDDTSS